MAKIWDFCAFWEAYGWFFGAITHYGCKWNVRFLEFAPLFNDSWANIKLLNDNCCPSQSAFQFTHLHRSVMIAKDELREVDGDSKAHRFKG